MDHDVDSKGIERVTHHKYVCEACSRAVWVPTDAMSFDSTRHEERLFCGCIDQGNRMGRVYGPKGNVSL